MLPIQTSPLGYNNNVARKKKILAQHTTSHFQGLAPKTVAKRHTSSCPVAEIPPSKGV